MQTVSICIPTWNRCDLTLKSFEQVYDDERVKEVVISDDSSELELYYGLKSFCDLMPKVRLHRNVVNIDCFKNKYRSIELAKSEWIAIIDSDNEIDSSYLDAVYKEQWSEDTILQPCFAMPHFDFREFSGLTITKENVAQYIDRPMFATMLNAMNFFINRKQYLQVFDGSIDPVTSDSIFFNYTWLAAGNKIKVVDGLQYSHRVHAGSHYQNNCVRTPHGFHEEIENNLRQLK